jgi:hypothetical protein
MSIAEAVAALTAANRRSTTTAPVPPATAIVAAYLPNEVAVVVPTLRSFLAASSTPITARRPAPSRARGRR